MAHKIKEIIKDPYKLWGIIVRRVPIVGHSLSDEEYISVVYREMIGKKLDLQNPQTFNEKIQWLKIHDRKPQYTMMVDKYEVKKYVSGIIGSQYIIPTIGVWERFDDIDFGVLPNQFVIKCTHDSGGLVIVRDKNHFDVHAAKLKIEKCMGINFYNCAREWPYKNVKPRIIVEKYLENEYGELKDYKIMCFNGKAYCSFVCSERFSDDGLRVTFYDRDWNRLPFTRHYPSSQKEIRKPLHYKKMIDLAEKLSKDISFLRVDFYECNDQLYFGELTFYPGGGFEEFDPEIWDDKLGKLIKLPEDNGDDRQ